MKALTQEASRFKLEVRNLGIRMQTNDLDQRDENYPITWLVNKREKDIEGEDELSGTPLDLS